MKVRNEASGGPAQGRFTTPACACHQDHLAWVHGEINFSEAPFREARISERHVFKPQNHVTALTDAENLKGYPGARIQIFSVTILGEAKWPQIRCLSLKGEFRICNEASLRIVEKIC
jgi:hypothetical protein